MRVITLSMSDIQVELIETLMQLGMYSGRSELIRAAIHELLVKETELEEHPGDLRLPGKYNKLTRIMSAMEKEGVTCERG